VGSRPDHVTDPLSSGDLDGGLRARARLRQAGALLFGAGAATLAGVLLTPDPDVSDHAALGACAAVFAVAALVFVLWRGMPEPLLLGICPLGIVAVTATVAVAEPIALTPVFYLWPMLIAAYFLSPRAVAANFAFAMAACGTALALWADPVLRLATFVAVAAIVGVVAAVVATLRAQIARLIRRLGEQATIDSLTGALNRAAFEQRLEAELARCERSESHCALVVFDIDHFKRINDSYGHAAGDHALRSLARAVEDGKRRSDVFARVGGEEFAIVLPDTDLHGATAFAESLRERLAGAQAKPALTVSLGVSDLSTSGPSMRRMLQQADDALYAAKRAGQPRGVRSAGLTPHAPLGGLAP